jgi:hypothetical protein
MTTVVSTHGTFEVSRDGSVVSTDELNKETFGSLPYFVNWTEWLIHYKPNPLPESVDILDIGYLTTDGNYTPPCQDWRNDRDVRKAEDAKAEAERTINLPDTPEAEVSMEAQFEYKCRRCGDFNYNPCCAADMATPMLICTALDPRDKSLNVVGMHGVHQCIDGGMGLTDLVGYRLEDTLNGSGS